MSSVTVTFFANIRQSTEMESIDVDLPPTGRCTLKDLVGEINRLVPVRLSSYKSSGSDGIPVRIVVNGTIVHTIDSKDNTINKGDHIAIYPLLSGG